MKVTGFLMMTVFLWVSVSGDAQTVNISGKDIPLKKIFDAIKKQTGTFFFYDSTLVTQAKPVTVELKNAPLVKALNEIFSEQPLTWLMEDKTITIIERPGLKKNATGLPQSSPAPSQVKGIVSDSLGDPIAGVSISIKGKKQGVISDQNGRYSITANSKDILVFSSVSYSTKELRVEASEMNIQLELEVRPLESLLVGGNLAALKRKADATSVAILDAKTLEKIPVNTIDQVFRGWVPGVNSFDVGDNPAGATTLSIRGASSAISLSSISVYIDGIEYAGGSGYLSQLDKNNVDRIEIVRGPGAATLYGTGSNGGIVQIFTKKGKADGSRVSVTSSAGFIKSKWVHGDAFQQMHNLESVNGFGKVSLTLGGSYRANDAYLPDGGEKNKGFYTGAKFNLGKLQANLIVRYNERNFNVSRSPLFDTAIHSRTDIIIEPYPGYTTPAYEWFDVRPKSSRYKKAVTETYITGINLSHRTTNHWVNNLVAGYTSNSDQELPLTGDTIALQRQYFSDNYNTTTIRYSNVLNLQNSSNGFALVISSGAEFKNYSASETYTRSTAAASSYQKDPDNKNYAAFVQANPSYENVYLTLGMRYEKNELFNAAWNPRLGLTTNFDILSIKLKPRISWGRGITPPSYEQRFGHPLLGSTMVVANPEIKPQSQQGFDYGLEIYDKKGSYKFEAVYYDNLLKDMYALRSLGVVPGNPDYRVYQYYTIGKVSNRGWEFSGGYQLKRFSLQGTFSSMNSTIKDSTGSYNFPQLQLPPGGRLVNLPRHTAGFNLTYDFPKLFRKADNGSVSINITEMDGVKTVDFINYLLDISYGRAHYNGNLFGYPVTISPVYRFGIYADYYITRKLRFFMQGSNILNDYNYDYRPENVTHGAAWLFGIKCNLTRSK